MIQAAPDDGLPLKTLSRVMPLWSRFLRGLGVMHLITVDSGAGNRLALRVPRSASVSWFGGPGAGPRP
jgi:hypothetical protein